MYALVHIIRLAFFSLIVLAACQKFLIVKAYAADVEVLTTQSPNARTVTIEVPDTAIDPAEVAVVMNTADPQSVEVASYYTEKYGLSPEKNLIKVSFDPSPIEIYPESFFDIREQVESQLSESIQVLAL